MADHRALIIGAGPGGLTAAVALRRVGIQADVFERAPKLEPIGAGFGLQANAIRALTRIGLREELLQVGALAEWQEMYSSKGKLLARLPIGEVARERGAPGVTILRADYQRTLLGAIDPSTIHLGHECLKVDTDSGAAYFANGTRAQGRVVIGADGHASVVRQAILGDTPKSYSGFSCWRGVSAPLTTEEAFPSNLVRLYGGPGAQFGMFPLLRGRVYWAGMIVRPEGETDPGGAWQGVLDEFGDWPAPARALIEATDPEAVIRSDIYDREPRRPWSKGRAVLLGDAAHLTTPFMGQGCGISVEDALVLAKELSLTDGLSDETSITIALQAYEGRRADRASDIVLQSRSNGETLRKAGPKLAARQRVLSMLPASKLRAEVAQGLEYEV